MTPRARTAAVTLVLVLGLTLLFIKAGSVSPEAHQAYERELRHSRQIDADLNLSVLSSRFGLLPHYDPLVSQAQALREHLRLLDVPPSFVRDDARAELDQRLRAYRDAVQRKLELVERFKRENAVLRNSLAYFPYAASRLSGEASGAARRELARKVDSLLQAVIMYIQTMDESTAGRVGSQAQALRADEARLSHPALRAALENVLRHEETLLRTKPLLDGITGEIIRLPTQRYNEEVFRFYTEQHERALAVASTYRYFLYLFALLLVAHIVTIIVKLRQASLDLSQANAELQMRIEERRRAEQALGESEERYRMLFNSGSDAIFVHTMDPATGPGRFVAVNDVACRRLGYTREELLQRTPLEIDAPEAAVDVAEIARRLEAERHALFETVHLARDGTPVPMEINAHLFDFRGQPTVLSVARDITQRRRAEEELRLYAKVFSNASEAIVITDARNVIVAANRAFSEITGYGQAETVGKTPAMLRSGRHGPAFYQNMWAAVEQTGQWHGEIWNRRKNGEIYPEWLSISAVHNPQGGITNYIALFTDITEQKQNEERIRYLAHHDALTGLPNRLLLQDRLSQAILQADRSRQKVALLFVDLDRFKVINDTLGHDRGDQLLRLVAERLRSAVRRIDTVSRQGGDEFVIVLPELPHLQDAAHIAQKVVRALADPFAVNEHELTITTSIGIALYPEDGRTPNELMRNADTAMYRAKAEGRNNYQYYTANMNAASLESLLLENQLRRSIERNELVIYFQPKLGLASGRMTGLEALLRWRHPDLGLVSPAKFIPLAEESGLIVPIGEWVLRSVCSEIRRWENAGLPPVRVAVNLSAHQFAQENLAETVAGALRENGLAPDRLELELTESALMRDLHRTTDILGELRAMGLHLSVDDFGTGYSSLSYLKQFPIEKLKIDQSFIGGIEKGSEDAAIASAIIALGHSLGLAVIAEGVETRNQYDFLKRQGCDEIQGHYYSAALPPEQIEGFLRAPAGVPLH